MFPPKNIFKNPNFFAEGYLINLKKKNGVSFFRDFLMPFRDWKIRTKIVDFLNKFV